MTSVQAPSFQIRPGIPQDTEQLCDLACELLTNIQIRGTPEDLRIVFQQILNSSERAFVVVAENDSALCGYAYASYEWRAEFSGETMDIVALYVAPEWRSKGVGRALVTSLLENARQRGIRRVSAE